MKHKRPATAILLCNLFLFLTVVFFSPMEVLLVNAKEFSFPFANVWWFQLLIALGGVLVMTGLMLLLPARAGQIAAGVSLALGIAAYIQSMFLNGNMVALTGEEMTVTPAGIVWNLVIWGAVILAVVLCVILFGRKHRKGTETGMRAAAMALLVMQTIGFISSAMTLDLTEKKLGHALTAEGEFVLGRERNAIVFVLDTADGIYAREMVKRYPELSEILSGWTWYPNAVPRYGCTYPSIPYMLTGMDCRYDRLPNVYEYEAYSTGAFLKGLNAAGCDIRIFTADGSMVSSAADPWVANSKGFLFSEFSNLNLPVLAGNLMKISLYKSLPYRFKDSFRYDMTEVNTLSFRIDEEDLPIYNERDDEFNSDLQDTDIILGEYSKAFRFYHLFGIHSGFDWDDKMEPLPEQEPGMPEPDRTAALRGCFLNIEEYIDQMKKLGIYDSSLIIVTADHGVSVATEHGKPLVRDEAACPILMVKYPHSDLNQPLREDKAPVGHEDLFATIEDGLGVAISGTGSGTRLNDHTEGEDRERLHYHTAKRSFKEGEIVMREYVITGDAEDIANWHLTGNWWDVVYSVNPVSSEPFP